MPDNLPKKCVSLACVAGVLCAGVTIASEELCRESAYCRQPLFVADDGQHNEAPSLPAPRVITVATANSTLTTANLPLRF
jgi:hypothetical protein